MARVGQFFGGSPTRERNESFARSSFSGVTEVSQSPLREVPRIDSTWHNENALTVLAQVEKRLGGDIPKRFRSIATQTCVRHILERGSLAAEQYYERERTENISSTKLAKNVGLNPVTLRRWIRDGKGRVNPLLYFAFFVSDKENEISDWTSGSIVESVLRLFDESRKTFSKELKDAPHLTGSALRFMAFCFCQKRSGFRLLNPSSDREVAFEEYLRAYFKHDEQEIRTHRELFAKALESYCYVALTVLNSIPARVYNHVLRT